MAEEARRWVEHSGIPIRHQETEVEPDGLWVDTANKLRGQVGTGFLNILIGKRGVGKTRIALSVIREACHQWVRRPEPTTPKSMWPYRRPAAYMKALDLFIALRATFKHDSVATEKSVIEDIMTHGLLVIDEIQERGNSEWEDRMLVHVVDKRYDAKLDTLLIGNLQPEQLRTSLGASILSRVEETGGVFIADWPSFRTPKP